MTGVASGGTRGWDAYAPLYDEHHEHLFRVALLLCHGQRAAAEDAVAETFIKVFHAWSHTDIAHFFAYARRTLVRVTIGQQRRRQVAAAYLERHGTIDDGVVTVEDQVAISSTTFEALELLPARQRTAVVLRYYEDLPYDQIADLMGVTTGTVKAQVSVGLGRLRQVMIGAQP
ncbi:MAG: RNA polymerase sigma factor [Desertimonas sp.]